MPRHRKERVPWHRAQRQAETSARRARLSAATNTAIAVLDDPRPVDPDAVDTAPLPLPARVRAAAHARARQRRVHPEVLRGATRGLLVTPWFAAASGFVIAASLWIYSPHAALLQFPDNATQLQHCRSQGCPPGASGKGSGSLAAAGKNRLKEPRKSGASPAGGTGQHARSAVSGLDFRYFVLASPDGKFTIRISVSGKRRIKDWSLAFALEGDRIRTVSGASWQRTTRDSGTASGSGQAWQWPGGGQGDGGQSGGDHHEYGFTFVVSGSGPAVAPTSCVYNGQQCTFTAGWAGPSHGDGQ
jgi:hypothetical protein